MNLFLGLAEPEDLMLIVVFRTDVDLASFRAGNHEAAVVARFRQHLSRSAYPRAAASRVALEFYSHEAIMRGGGYNRYFS